MGYFRTPGGTILELDVPAEGTHAGDLHTEKVEKGELQPVDDSLVETIEEQYGVDPRTGDPLVGTRLAFKADRKAKPKEHDPEPYRAAHVAAGPVEIVQHNPPVMLPRFVEPFDIEATDVEEPTQVVPLDEEGEPLEVGEVEDSRPAGNAPHAEWLAYAISKGADPEEAEGKGRNELRDLYGA